MAKKVIWSSEINMNDWEEYVQEQKEEGFIEKDSDGYKEVVDLMNEYLEDERMNLDIPTEGRILVIASLGLWNGRKSAYKILNERNVNAILSNGCDEIEWYCDGHNIKAIGKHHDGTNYYEYREIREDKEDNIYKLLNRIYNGEPVSRQMINYYTKSIAPQVKAVYGW